MGEVGISNHRWKKYFSFLDRGPKTLKFSASFIKDTYCIDVQLGLFLVLRGWVRHMHVHFWQVDMQDFARNLNKEMSNTINFNKSWFAV